MDGMKKQDDLLKNAIARTIDKAATEISIDTSVKKNVKRKKRVDKKKVSDSVTTIKSGEGLEVDYETQYIGFDQIAGRGKRVFKVKPNVFEWDKSLDFVYYIFDLYKKKFNENLSLNSTAASLEISRIRDDLYDVSGIISPLIARDYISFCFNNFIPGILKKGKGFYFSQLRNDSFMKIFMDNYNYAESLKREYHKKDKKIEKTAEKIDTSEIEQSYLISERKMVETFGIIISINWLIVEKKMLENNAVDMVYDICKRSIQKGAFEKIEKSTLEYSPYSEWLIYSCQFKDFLSKIKKEIFVKFENNNIFDQKFNFLKKGENGTSY